MDPTSETLAAAFPDGSRVRAVQVAVLRRSFPFALSGSVIAACFSAYALYGVVPDRELAPWIGAMLLVAALRWAAMLAYDRSQAQPDAAERWLRRMFLGNLASGMLWGLPVAYWSFFLPVEYQLFSIVILIGLGTGAIYSNYIVLPVVYAFEIPALAPPFIALAAQPSPLHIAMVASGVAYVASTLAFTHRMHRTHLDALRLGYENLALLEQVRREKEAAERSNLEKSRFLAAASHDLRQPVHAVSLFLGLLTNEKLTAHGRYLVDNIASATAAMGHLFDALLNISRLDAGVIEPRRKWFPLNPLLEQLRAEYAPQAVQKGLSLRVRPSKAVVNSDPVLLERILRNLISNAIAHTRRGGVLVGCRHRRGGVRILVCDTGPGIPPSEQERVFWEFHQLNNPERDRSKGLGLGLAIVRRTAALLDHPLVLASQEGRGTLFSLGLETRSAEEALAATPPAPEPAPPAPAAGDAIPDHGRGRMVLVVDDDAQNLAGLTLLLESWGYRVVGAASGDALFAKVVHEPERPALIISDYRLREHETGIHVIERLREEYSDPPIPALLVSGDTDPGRLIEAADRNIPLLHKPVEVEDLRAHVTALLHRPRQTDSEDSFP